MLRLRVSGFEARGGLLFFAGLPVQLIYMGGE